MAFRRLLWILFAALGWVSVGGDHVAGPQPAQAQGITMTCPALVQTALTALEDNCAELGRNQACYAFNRVGATFQTEVVPGTLSQPGHQTELTPIQTISTVPLDLALEQWGVALLHVQANIPFTLPDANVRLLLLGDVVVENAVPAEAAAVPIDPLTVMTLSPTALHRTPNLTSRVEAELPPGTPLAADGLAANGEWVRVLHQDTPGWVEIGLIDMPDVVSTLPVVSGADSTPLQSFSFRTGLDAPLCSQAPSVLAIQNPDRILAVMRVNGSVIRVGGTLALQSVSDDEFTLTVHRGRSFPIPLDEVVADAGQTITARLDENGRVAEWLPARAATPDELQIAQLVSDIFERLNGGDEAAPAATGGSGCGPNRAYTVRPGDTLFRLASRFGTTVDAIMRANALTDSRLILAGQPLAVPCADGVTNIIPGSLTPAPLSPSPAQPAAPPAQVPAVDCTGFRPTAPLDGFPYGSVIFFWDAPASAGVISDYRVVVRNDSGEAVAAFVTEDGSTTSVNGDVGGRLGEGFAFTWQLQARVGSRIVCQAPPVSVLRESPP